MKTSNLVTILCVMLMGASLKANVKKIKITNGYHHQSNMNDKLVLYFSQRPICTHVPSREFAGEPGKVPVDSNGVAQLEFFLPLTEIGNRETKNFIAQLNATDNDLYKMRFEQDYKKGGLKCLIAFRPNEVGFHQESFEAITGQPALAFSFFKREAMKQINSKVRPLLRSTQLKKKLV